MLAASALAHPEHDEAPRASVQKSIPQKAQDAVLVEITRAKLDPTWRTAAAGKAELRTVAGALRWVVPFTNPAAKNAAERTLYVTLTQQGKFVGASFRAR
jgi:hypothetical protein